MRKDSRRAYGLMLLAALIFYSYIAFCVPYCHDDWDWGLEIGMEQWLHATLNSRYAGNFFVVAMTRSQLFKTAVMALTMTGTALLLGRMAHRERLAGFLLANVLLLGIPQLMWQQTYGWVSAFANYVVPVPWLLFLLGRMERAAAARRGSDWICVPLALALCLFSENLTIYLLLCSIVFAVVCAVRKNAARPLSAAVAAACVLGTVIMFSSPVYRELAEQGQALEGIRRLSASPHVSLGARLTVWTERLLGTILPAVCCSAPAAPACAAAALIAGALKRKASPGTLIPAGLAAGLTLCVILQVKAWWLPPSLLICLGWLIAGNPEGRGRKLFLLLSAPLVVLPMAAVEEWGLRLYFLPHVFWIALALCALPELKPGWQRRLMLAAPGLMLVGFMLFYGGIYTEIRAVTVARAEAIEAAVERGDQQVIMKKDPNKYWWGRNPTGEGRVPYFKAFYGIPEEMQVIFAE